MPLEVIGAGLGRTGTLSLKVALEELGFGPCYHMIELFGHPEHVELWEAASEGKPVDWEGLFGGYRATTDWPACSFYRELMQRYPDARVILTVRDPDFLTRRRKAPRPIRSMGTVSPEAVRSWTSSAGPSGNATMSSCSSTECLERNATRMPRPSWNRETAR